MGMDAIVHVTCKGLRVIDCAAHAANFSTNCLIACDSETYMLRRG